MKINGYNITAVAPDMTDGGVAVIFGVNPTREHSKYITAKVNANAATLIDISQEDAPREWYWGHYFEDYSKAIVDFVRRTRIIGQDPIFHEMIQYAEALSKYLQNEANGESIPDDGLSMLSDIIEYMESL